MVGAIIIAHGNLAEEFLKVTELLAGKQDIFKAISIDSPKNCQEAASRIKKAIKEVDRGCGIVLFTDMFGGTPSNLGLSFLDKKNVEVITGVNLSMLIRLATVSSEKSLNEIKKDIVEFGRQDIRIASDMLRGKK